MTLPGSAFLALWNDRAETRDDYEAWHSREHIPERLGVPGILAARRYVSGKGPLPPYFTLYPLSDLKVLDSTEYRTIVNRPTEWSLSMRPALTHMYRQGCDTSFSIGAGIAGNLAAAVLRRSEGELGLEKLAEIVENESVSALHVGTVRSIAPLAFESRGDQHLPQGDAILLVEMFDTEGVDNSLPRFDEIVKDSGFGRILDWTIYRLALALDTDEAANALPLRQELAASQVHRVRAHSGD